MNRSKLILLVLLVISCKETEKEFGEACSVKLPQIHFTKSLHHADENTSVENNKITMRSDAGTDYFNEPDGTQPGNSAPVLLSKVNNTKHFTLTAKVTPQFITTYDAGALYIYSTETLWQKFAFEKDEQGKTRIVSVRTIETSDDNNHDAITHESVYLKISSDTKTVGFYYSGDSITWNLVRIYKNNYPSTIWVGISSQSPLGNGNITYFENCSLIEKSISDFRKGI
jgi:regulation of enolase protein 1 (concanavalin A-like superfamily)